MAFEIQRAASPCSAEVLIWIPTQARFVCGFCMCFSLVPQSKNMQAGWINDWFMGVNASLSMLVIPAMGWQLITSVHLTIVRVAMRGKERVVIENAWMSVTWMCLEQLPTKAGIAVKGRTQWKPFSLYGEHSYSRYLTRKFASCRRVAVMDSAWRHCCYLNVLCCQRGIAHNSSQLRVAILAHVFCRCACACMLHRSDPIKKSWVAGLFTVWVCKQFSPICPQPMRSAQWCKSPNKPDLSAFSANHCFRIS